MKYVVTGGAGHISGPLTEKLLAAGNQVTVISRNADHLKSLIAKGANAAIGSVEDVEFLKKSFAGANAVYTMVPPNFAAPDMKGFIEQIAKNYAVAITANKIKYVVNLSSIGAHLPDGTGPVTGLHRGENILNAIPDINIKHLRPSYFYQNLFSNLGMVKQMNIIGGNFNIPSGKFPLSDPTDIAAVAAEELLNLGFNGHSVRYMASEETGTDEIAATIGKEIGKPDLKWVSFPDDQALNGMLQAGLPKDAASNYVEMGQSMQSGKFFEDYWKEHPATLGKVKLKDFARQFASAYQAN